MQMEGSAIWCVGFWIKLVLRQGRRSQVVEILPSPLLLEVEKRKGLSHEQTAGRPSPVSSPLQRFTHPSTLDVHQGKTLSQMTDSGFPLYPTLIAITRMAANKPRTGSLKFCQHLLYVQLFTHGLVRLSFSDPVLVLQ